jgi:hypothetical protein
MTSGSSGARWQMELLSGFLTLFRQPILLQIIFYYYTNLMNDGMFDRYRLRFFAQVGHQTTTSSGNEHFFTK